MKKIGIVLLLVFTLLTTAFTVNAEQLVSPLTLQDRLNNKGIDIIDEVKTVLIDSEGNKVTTIDEASKARLTYTWSLTQEESKIVETNDTYEFTLAKEFTTAEDLQGDMSEYGTFTIREKNKVKLTFNVSQLKEEGSLKGELEVLVDILTVKEETPAVPEELPVVEEETLIVSKEEPKTGPMSVHDRIKDKLSEDTGIDVDKLPITNIIMDANMKFYENGVEVKEPTIDADVTVKFDWSLMELGGLESLHGLIENGDFYVIEMPKELKFSSPTSGELKGKDEFGNAIIFGTFEVTAEGDIKLIFNDEVQNFNDVKGILEISGKLDRDGLDGTGENVIKLPVKDDKEFTINVRPKENNKQIEKKGFPNKDKNADEIKWEIRLNGSYADLENAYIEDLIGTGHTFESIKIEELTIDFDGVETRGDDVTAGYTIDTTKNPIRVDFENIKTPYIVTIVTKIDESIVKGEVDSALFRNDVTLGSKDIKPLPTYGTVDMTYGKYIHKDNATQIKDTDGIVKGYNWTIEFNQRGNTYKDVVLKDVMSDSLELDASSLKIIGTGGTVYQQGVDFDLVYINGTSEFEIKFLKDVTEGLTINYNSYIKDGVIINDKTEIKNKVTTNIEGKEGNGTGVVVRGLVKNSPKIDYNANTVDWSVKINGNRSEVRNGKIVDTFISKGMTLKKDTLSLVDVTKNNYKLIEDTDYNFVLAVDGNSFEIILINSYATMSSELKLAYTADFDKDKVTSIKGVLTLVNGVVFSGNNKHNLPFTDSDQESRPLRKETNNNGIKHGRYDAKTKKITWSVYVNYTGEALKDAKLTDTLLQGQVYVGGSLKIKNYQVAPNGDITLGADVTLEESKIDHPGTNNGNTLTVRFPDGTTDNKYFVEFETTVKDAHIQPKYDNTADFENADKPKRNLTASVSIANGGSVVDKTAQKENGGAIGNAGVENGSTVRWSIAINQSQSKVYNPVIKDKSSGNLIIDNDSFKLYPVEMKSDGTYTVLRGDNALVLNTDYTIGVSINEETGEQVTTITLTVKKDTDHQNTPYIDEVYVLEYDSIINAPTETEKKVTNKVEFTGDDLKFEKTDDGEDFNVVVDDSMGTGGGKALSYSIKKVDEEGNPLKGVVFELYNRFGKLVATKTTDESGVIVFHRVLRGTHTLKEVSTNQGFVIDEELFLGKGIIIKEETSEENLKTPFVNKRNKLIIKKQGPKGLSLLGTKFLIEKELMDGNFEKYVEFEISNPNGTHEITSIPAGSYRLTETSVGDTGLILNTKPVKFVITKNEVTGYEIDLELTFQNYLGRVQLSKTGFDGKALQDAMFTILKADKKTPVVEGLKSNAHGIVSYSSLAPGTYYFQETASAGGHIINTNLIEFVIVDSASGEPAVVEVAAQNIKASASFEKQGLAGVLLDGAQFTLTKEGDTNFVMVSTSVGGRVEFLNLSPGVYSYVETKAPNGYLVDSTVRTFTIDGTTDKSAVKLELPAVTNYKASIKLTKSGTQGVLKGVKYLLTKADDELVKIELTSNKDGVVLFENLSPGEYSIVEVSTVDGHILDTRPIPVTVPEVSDVKGGTHLISLERTNVKASAELIKVDASGKGLKGAIFKLFNQSDDKFVAEATSDKDGIVSFEDISVGEYYIKETKAPSGYVLNTDIFEFTVLPSTDEDKVHFILGELINHKGSIRLVKTDYLGELLELVEFDLLDSDGVVISSHITDINGEINIGELSPGFYSLVETKSAEGNIINTVEIPFEILVDGLNIPKLVELASNNTKATAFFVKKGLDGNLLDGAEFTLIKKGDDEFKMASKYVNGRITFANLSPGEYSFVETKAPEGYLLDTTVHTFTVDVDTILDVVEIDLGTVTNYQAAIELTKNGTQGVLEGVKYLLTKTGEESVEVEGKTNKDGVVLFENLSPGEYSIVEVSTVGGHILDTRPIKVVVPEVSEVEGGVHLISLERTNVKASAELVKVDALGKVLEGAIFGLYNQSDDKLVVEATSDKEGIVSFSNIAVGSYYVKEVEAAKGYVLNTDVVKFVVGPETDEDTVHFDLGKFVNYKGSVKLVKTDYLNEVLSGAEFNLLDSKGKVVSSHITDVNGEIVIDELSPGKYALVETKSAGGNIINTVPLTFEILESGLNLPQVIELTSNNTKASASFKKTDVLGNGLAGAEFKLFSKDGTAVNPGTVYTSDAKGIVSAKDLEPGDYYFLESKSALGYILNTTKHAFTVENETALDSVHIDLDAFINYTGSFELTKTDAKGKTISEARFEIYDSNNSLISNQFTVDGVLRIEGLAPGTYTVKETQAPKGYKLSTKVYEFVIVSEFEGEAPLVSMSVVNIAIELPATGISKNYSLELGALFILLGSGMVTLKVRRRKESH